MATFREGFVSQDQIGKKGGCVLKIRDLGEFVVRDVSHLASHGGPCLLHLESVRKELIRIYGRDNPPSLGKFVDIELEAKTDGGEVTCEGPGTGCTARVEVPNKLR
jgi:hypothetical protein